ncbi:MAG: YggU family protein [Acidobacteria bacterium]|nr:MAG: YggU family protein [Acidobacteriota bacterium]PYV74953.1 MAG: YggU family protein [Acidobacteriota bacterium]PYV77274.1 MAG: YggU family protein [Acidobacteriota bacterium]PYX11592.1 MAG: YggU family protein [Acidobacteriota bacterium]
MIALHETSSGITFAVRVQPRARRKAIVGEFGEALKIALTAPPVDGRANEACVEFLAEVLRLPRSSVTIISGQGSRNKVVRVTGCTAAHVRGMLNR